MIEPVGYWDPPDDTHYYCAVCDHECREDDYRTWRRGYVCDDCADADAAQYANEDCA